MRARLLAGGRVVEVVDGREPDWRDAAGAASPSAARALLAPHVEHPVTGRELRELLARVDGAATVWRLRDAQVLDALAWRLFCGDLRLLTAETLARVATALPPIPDSVRGTVEQAPPAPRPVFREAPPPPSEAPPDELADLEQDVQAAALEEAAEQGTPFCEECDRRRRELAGAGA